MFYGYSNFLILVPALIVSFWAQTKVSSTFEKYSKVYSMSGLTGAQTARMLLDTSGLYDIPVEVVPGRLSDHYDPRSRVMRLSKEVFYGTSVASIGVAAHETGHAIQHKLKYAPLTIRNSIIPLVNISSNLSWGLFVLGLVLGWANLINFGILLFSAVVVFQLITLPVEFNASKRAITILSDKGILYTNELSGAKAVLDAAAMTYVAAALMAVSQLLRLIMMSNRNSD
ncbi:zinc metallopeptidase [Clostridium swellfunianum]|uniref:zinc metallopeptidase n=1 Tax=Clostridium swellfunianum TaxID=1367462 RepID=UPI00202F61DA|nr:zinc metallopeptidase [Clostridium swellfunianum]MCM0648728.1 zinc metallopeptidase [Clostridium swellfunianum]